MKKIVVFVLCFCVISNLSAYALDINPDRSGWFKWEMPNEEFVKGTAIDMSFILEKNAGSHGFVHTEGENIYFADGTRARFWGTNVCGEANFQTQENARILADRIARSGYNMVRFHHLDAMWAEPNIFGNSTTTRKLDEEYLDRLFYFMSLLKEKGVYFYVDTLVNRTPYAEEDNILSTEDLGQGWGVEAEFDPYLIQLQKEYIEQLFTAVNPYTGMALCDDPALIFVDIQNENSLLSLTKNSLKTEYYRLQLEKKFNAWVINKYASEAELISAWETLDTGEAYGSIRLYDDYKDREYNNTRKNDVYKFLYDTTGAFYTDMISYMRGIGIKCLITGVAMGGSTGVSSPASFHLAAKTSDFIDRHNYISHPKDWNFGNGTEFYDMKKPQTSIEGGGYLLYYPAMQRIYGKPYILSEWQECVPNRYRTEAPLVMSAYACYQNWHSLNFSILTGNVPKSPQALSNAFDTFNDPINTANISYSSLIFHRSEVSEGEIEYFAPHNKSSVMKSGYTEFGGNHYVPPYGKTGIMFTDICDNSSARDPENLRKIKQRADAAQAQNEQIDWDYIEGIFELNTEYTNAATGYIGKRSIDLDYAVFDMENEFASVALSSVTNKTLDESERLLLTTTARAENTGMEMSDTGSALNIRGTAPVLVEPVAGNITIKTSENIAVYALSSSGVRTARVPVKENSDGNKCFSVGGMYETVYYEIVKGVEEICAIYNEKKNVVTVTGLADNLNNQTKYITITAMTGNYDLSDINENNAADRIDFVKVVNTDSYGRYTVEYTPGKLYKHGRRNIFVNISGKVVQTSFELPITDTDLPFNKCVIGNSGWIERQIYCGKILDGYSCRAVDKGVIGYTDDNKLKIRITKAFSGVCFTEKNGFGITDDYIESGYISADISMENCYDKVRISMVCYPSGVYKEFFGGTLDITAFAVNADGTRHITVPLKDFGINSEYLGIIKELRIQAYGKGTNDTFTEANPGYMYLDNVSINMYYDDRATDVLWTAYDNGYPQNVTGRPQTGAAQEQTEDGILKITCTSPAGIRFCNSEIVTAINEYNKSAVYIKFSLKKENMQTNKIRVIFWAEDWWNAKEFGAWTVDIADTEEWQEISIPMGSFESDYWNEIKGIRIDPYEPWDAETITEENPAVMYLDDLRVEADYRKELILETGFWSDPKGENRADSLTSAETVYAGLSYCNKLNESRKIVLVIGVYNIAGRLKECIVEDVQMPAFGKKGCRANVLRQYTPEESGESIRIFVWNDIGKGCTPVMNVSGIRDN